MEEGEWIRAGGPNVSARGINYLLVQKAGKIGSVWCEPGDIVAVEKSSAAISPPDDCLTDGLADFLIKHGRAKAYNLKPGDKVKSVRGINPKPLPTPEEHKLESATDPNPRGAERAVTGRQKAGAI